MPKYTVRDDAGNALVLEGDSPPTEQELEDIFAKMAPKADQSGNSQMAKASLPWDSGFSSTRIDSSQALQKQFGEYPSPEGSEVNMDQRMMTGISPISQRQAEITKGMQEARAEEVPYALRIGAAAHTGLSKGAYLPGSLIRAGAILGEELPSVSLVRGLAKAVLPESLGTLPEKAAKSNREYFQKLGEWEKWMSQRDEMLGEPDFGTQLAEGVARGFAELPVQMLGGVAGGAGGSTAAAMRGAATGAGVTAGAQTFGQELGQGTPEFTALTRGATAGLITGLTTRAFGTTGVESIFRKEGVGGVVNRVKRALIEAGYEGAEEATDQFQQELMTYIDKNPDQSLEDTVRNVMLAGTVGAVLGGGMGAMGRGDVQQPTLQMPMRIEGGETDASKVQEAAAVHGDVRPQPSPPTVGQVPVQEGGPGVQPEAQGGIPLTVEEADRFNALQRKFFNAEEMTDAEVKELDAFDARLPKPQINPETQALVNEAINQNQIVGMVSVVSPSKISRKNPLYRRLAQYNPDTGRIEVNIGAIESDLGRLSPEDRRDAVMSVIGEEMIHSYTLGKDAEAFANDASWAERRIAASMYTGNVSGTFEGAPLSNMNLGYEMMRARIQRMMGMTRSEIATTAGMERWTMRTLDLMERSIAATRRHLLRTKASQRQVQMLDDLAEKIGFARQAVTEAGGGGAEEPIGAPRRMQSAEEVISAPRGTAEFDADAISQMPDEEVARLFTQKDEKGGQAYAPQYGSVIWGASQPRSEVPKLESMRDAAMKRLMAEITKGDKMDRTKVTAEQGRMLWYSGALEGVKRAGGNYQAVLERGDIKPDPENRPPIIIGSIRRRGGQDEFDFAGQFGEPAPEKKPEVEEVVEPFVKYETTPSRPKVPEPPAMNPLLRDATLLAFKRIQSAWRAKASKTHREEVAFHNATLEAYYGMPVENLTDDFEDAVWNLAAMPVNEWPMNAKDKAALLEYFNQAKGTKHDRAKLIEGNISGQEWVMRDAIDKRDVLKEAKRGYEMFKNASIPEGSDMTAKEMSASLFLPPGKGIQDVNNLIKFYDDEWASAREDKKELEKLLRQVRGEQGTVGAPRRGDFRNAQPGYDAAVALINKAANESEGFRLWNKFDQAFENRVMSIMRTIYGTQAEDFMDAMEGDSEKEAALIEEAKDFGRARQQLYRDYKQRWGEGQQAFPAAPRRGIGKREAERIEEQRKYRELMIAKGTGGKRSKVEAAGEAMSRRLANVYEPPTPESIEKIGSEALNQQVPSFEDFLSRVRTRHGDIQSGQVAEAWADQVWKFLNNASGEKIKAMVDNLGLRRQVFGRVKKQGTTIQLGGNIADAPTGAAPEAQMTKTKQRIDRLTKKATEFEAQSRRFLPGSADNLKLKQLAEVARRTADNLSRGLQTGEGVERVQSSLFPGIEARTSQIIGEPVPVPGKPGKFKYVGRKSNIPEIEPSGALRARDRAIAVIGRALLGQRTSLKSGLNRKSINAQDVRWTELGGEIYKVSREDMGDLEQLGMMLTQGAATDASTQRMAAGGSKKIKEQALPRSATKRVVALLDNVTKKVHLVSAYRDGRRGPVFLDPGSVTGEHRSLEQLKRYRPLYSIPLDLPVQNFHEQFDSFKDFSDRFYRNVQLMARRVGWRGYGTEPPIEGTEGLEGEGGMLQGPEALIARAEMGMVSGARDVGVELTPAEARAAYREFRFMETEEDVEHMMSRLRRRAQKNLLRPQDWQLITAMTKVNEAMISERDKLLADLKKKVKGVKDVPPPEFSLGMYRETLNKLYELAKRNETGRAFIAASQREFTEGRGLPAEAGPTEARPSPFTKELTMPLERVAPTVVRPEQLPPGTKPVERRPPPPVGEFGGGLKPPPPREPVTKAQWKYVSGMVRTHAKERARQPKYERMIPEGFPSQLEKELPSKTEKYEVSPARKAEIQAHINEIANRMLEKEQKEKQAKAQQPQQPEGPQQGMLPGMPIGALRRRPPISLAEMAQNVLSDFGSIYDKWMVDRLDDYGGPESKRAAAGFRHIIDREKELYGGLTPLLDRARRLAGGIESSRQQPAQQTLAGRIREIPVRVVESAKAIRAVNWLNKLNPVTANAATSNLVGAIEGTRNVPPFARNLVSAAQAANMEIGMLLQAVSNFVASGKYQRNINAMGYDIIRQGGGKLWDEWTRAVSIANRGAGATLSKVRSHFRLVKKVLDDPMVSGATIERINQDMARRYPNVVTHLKTKTGWQPVIHADLFNYLEGAARRATHVRAFREQFPNTTAGRKSFQDLMDDLRRELPDEVQRDVGALIRALHGHPTDDYSGSWQDYIRMGPQQTMGQVMRLMNLTINNLLSKMVLTGQMFVQPGEVIAGSTPVFLGYKNYLKAMARAKQLYPQLEMMGAVNRVMHDYTWNPNSPIRSMFKISGNLLSKVSGQNMLNEVQEALAATTARIVTENLMTGRLSDFEKRMLPQTFKAMGFNPGEVQQMMRGDYELLMQFQRKAAAFLTSGNKSIAEGSRLGANRLFNSIFRFQSYPMIKANQARQLMVNMVEAWRVGTPTEKRASTELMARYLFGNTLQGALTVGITALAYLGASGLRIRWEEAKDEPWSFMAEAFLASQAGPAYLLYRGAKAKGIFGAGEQALRAAFPYGVMNDLRDMVSGFGQYTDQDTFDRIGRFIKNKTPGTKAISTGLAMFGLGNENQPLEASIQALNRWKRDTLGFKEQRSYMEADQRKEFRTAVRQAIAAMKDGDEEAYTEAWMKAAELGPKGVASVKESLRSRKLLVGPDGGKLTEEQIEALQERIGFEAYDRLEYYDLMLDAAAASMGGMPELQ